VPLERCYLKNPALPHNDYLCWRLGSEVFGHSLARKGAVMTSSTANGSALLDNAEARSSGRSAVVGLGVGATADYCEAQRMYSNRG
jgi:hypothetical protein